MQGAKGLPNGIRPHPKPLKYWVGKYWGLGNCLIDPNYQNLINLAFVLAFCEKKYSPWRDSNPRLCRATNEGLELATTAMP